MSHELFNKKTRCIMYGNRRNPIQRMLDFDYICGRDKPSIAAVVDEGRYGFTKVFFGEQEILIPKYPDIKTALAGHKDVDVMLNFASFRSAYKTTMDALDQKQIKTVVIIAEGVPERHTREIIVKAKGLNKWVIGPATVGGIVAGQFKIGNTAGMVENIVASKLYRQGSVGFVSKSGGMSNEMYNVISRNSNGLYEGIAIGGDSYPGSTLLEHLLRYEMNPKIKMLVCLGELGGKDEYEIVEALKAKKIKKPIVAWVTGTCAKAFPAQVQFGHAGAKAGSKLETADEKNDALKKAGAIVPKSFDDLGEKIAQTYNKLKKQGKVRDIPESEVPQIPQNFKKALKQKKVRKPTNFICTISNDTGQEPTYIGVRMSELFEKGYGIGEVVGMLWFKKELPKYASKYIEMVLMITADHGPCVSGAHNAIIAARAGKDVVDALASGLLTIGPRFGGAVEGAAKYFKQAYESKTSPEDFVSEMKKKGIRIPGIGHRIKSVNNPDKRVEILKGYAKKNFKKTPLLDYALQVEKITTGKRGNLILNVDGCIGITMVDLFSTCGKFTKKEVDDIVAQGGLNSFFVLGRSIGMIGHAMDQYRLKSGMYRHPWDDVLFLSKKG